MISLKPFKVIEHFYGSSPSDSKTVEVREFLLLTWHGYATLSALITKPCQRGSQVEKPFSFPVFRLLFHSPPKVTAIRENIHVRTAIWLIWIIFGPRAVSTKGEWWEKVGYPLRRLLRRTRQIRQAVKNIPHFFSCISCCEIAWTRLDLEKSLT